jgi:anion-transporting  ArsA/GET3 family ATPase
MNKQTDPNIKTIRFPVIADSKLQKMAEKCGLTKINFFIAMVDYFYKSKKDPRDLSDELLKKELVKRTDRIIAFIKTTEDELLRPLITTSGKIHTVQQKIVDYFNQSIIKHNIEQKEEHQSQQVLLTSLQRSIQNIDKAQLSKAELKTKFSQILEYYIKARESMGMMSKQADKDALNQNVRQQLQNL